ncbi:transcription termination/antitermination NusG family protein [Paenibacillus sp. Leaf72]|uniref:transcription termination/antitermination NusG family protein n=1 Tax=Paenibacillus sp. Leaf72 TaxID=1736234 RepID=UPI0006FF3D79|nr:transcription termination/antitermination NusG family protein [Paenibacillus sp. Leaf72]KQN97042.1 hypothetical protein ASF12_23520 [Paenibacillus sp. Leaf72]
MTSTNWYALQVRTGFELEIAENVKRFAQMKNLKEQIKDTFAGVKKIVRMTTRGRKLDSEAVLTGYIFVKLDELTGTLWHFLKSVPGVYKILDMLPISSEEIEKMHLECAGEVEVRIDVKVETSDVSEKAENESQCVAEEFSTPAVQRDEKGVMGSERCTHSVGTEGVRKTTLFGKLFRSFEKGSKEIFRIPISVYKDILDFDIGLRDRVNERNPQYILSSIRSFFQISVEELSRFEKRYLN